MLHTVLQWLEEFLGYLDKWEESVNERDGEKCVLNMMLLPMEMLGWALLLQVKQSNVLEYIYFTVKSFMELVKYVFTIPGVEIFYSNKLCQDDLENFFAQQHQRGCSHENPNASQFVKNTQALRVINSTCRTIRGN